MKSIDGDADPNDSTWARIVRASTPRAQPQPGQENEISNYGMIRLQHEKIKKQIEQKRMVRS